LPLEGGEKGRRGEEDGIRRRSGLDFREFLSVFSTREGEEGLLFVKALGGIDGQRGGKREGDKGGRGQAHMVVPPNCPKAATLEDGRGKERAGGGKLASEGGTSSRFARRGPFHLRRGGGKEGGDSGCYGCRIWPKGE